MIIKTSYSNTPIWKGIHVHAELPAPLRPLEEITHKLMVGMERRGKSHLRKFRS